MKIFDLNVLNIFGENDVIYAIFYIKYLIYIIKISLPLSVLLRTIIKFDIFSKWLKFYLLFCAGKFKKIAISGLY